MHDDKLILYFYDDGLSTEEKRQIEAALENDEDLAARYRELQGQLSAFVEDKTPAVPDHVAQRWHDSIDRAACMERDALRKRGNGFNPLSFFWGAAITASLVVGIAIGIYISGGASTTPALNDRVVDYRTNSPTVIPTAFTRGLQVHLRDSQRGIASLPTQSDADRAQLILDILAQNRLFERAAEQKNSPQLARVLRAFEPILVRLAATDTAPEDVEALRAQLTFELNVMLTKLARETSEEQQLI
jgi:anti-sigma factor RsiW